MREKSYSANGDFQFDPAWRTAAAGTARSIRGLFFYSGRPALFYRAVVSKDGQIAAGVSKSDHSGGKTRGMLQSGDLSGEILSKATGINRGCGR